MSPLRRRLLGTAGIVVALVVLAASLPWLLDRIGMSATTLPWTPDCEAGPDGLGISREEARIAAAAAARNPDDPAAAVADTDLGPEVADAWAQAAELPPGPVLTCRIGVDDSLAAEELTDTGLTPRAQTLLEAMTDELGELSLGGFEPGGVTDGHGEDSAHYQGRAIDVFYRPVTEDNRHHGWRTADWLLAHADRYSVAVIIFDDRIISARLPMWRDYNSPDPTDDILSHRDHVHVDVQSGS